MSDYRERVQDAIDRNVCFYCGESMEGFTGARYGLNNSHWACYEASKQEQQEAFRRIGALSDTCSKLLDDLDRSLSKKKPR